MPVRVRYRNAIWRFRNTLLTQNEQNKNRQLLCFPCQK
jgi:hypothetical protein